jgi:hypothetical protein
MEGRWIKEWPTVPGRYWMRGFLWIKDRVEEKSIRTELVEVVLLGQPPKQTVTYVGRGNFIYPRECGAVRFWSLPVITPEWSDADQQSLLQEQTDIINKHEEESRRIHEAYAQRTRGEV